ncbi:MAG: fluoride efflux transporter CrcB [Acidobacteria bacterium]|nr:MAG: fluoride efflux transporter CrcB [Acidobacteriota bacterium]
MEFAGTVLKRTDDSWPPAGDQEFFYATCWRAERRQGLRIFLLILFGSLGTLARYAIGGLVQHRAGSAFPAGTLAVNLAGCFLLGGVGEYALQHLSIPPDWRIGITVGFFGAFTTFSSFTYESSRMLEEGAWMKMIVYVGVSVVGGLFLTVTGIHLADLMS